MTTQNRPRVDALSPLLTGSKSKVKFMKGNLRLEKRLVSRTPMAITIKDSLTYINKNKEQAKWSIRTVEFMTETGKTTSHMVGVR